MARVLGRNPFATCSVCAYSLLERDGELACVVCKFDQVTIDLDGDEIDILRPVLIDQATTATGQSLKNDLEFWINGLILWPVATIKVLRAIVITQEPELAAFLDDLKYSDQPTESR